MKKVIFLISCLVLLGHFSSHAQLSKIKKVGRSVVKTSKRAGRSVSKKAKSAGNFTKRQGRRVADSKVGKFTKRQTRKAANSRVGKAVRKTAVAPYKTIHNTTKVIRGKAGVRSIYRPYKEAIGATGKAVPAIVKGLTTPQYKMLQKARRFSRKIGGRYGTFVFDITTFVHQSYPHLADALAENVSAAANGKNPIQVVAAPLAAAIRAANESHFPNSKPIPQSVKNALKRSFPASVLNDARYAIGGIEITLPNGINKLAKYGDAHAVTVGNVIVFSEDPGSFTQNPVWWAHEIAHVNQYAKLGVETFAYKYMKDLGKSIEREAENTAQKIVNGK